MSYPRTRCSAFALGLGDLCSGSLALRIAGTAFSTAATALLICARRSIAGFLRELLRCRSRNGHRGHRSHVWRPSLCGRYTFGSGTRSVRLLHAGSLGIRGRWIPVTRSVFTIIEICLCPALKKLVSDHPANADPTSSVLRRLIVSPHHRRRKIGSLLLAAMLDRA
ncbi:hypothetical protein B0H14DRAFT_1187969 [Mycena olivaceomarginata]|nr:hypothetical protein B0H14DRAFT_1187969 [Mycena olivaceomarginata]